MQVRHDVGRAGIRPLFAFGLDVDERFALAGVGVDILEALLRYDMALMAGRVADREQIWLMAGTSQD